MRRGEFGDNCRPAWPMTGFSASPQDPSYSRCPLTSASKVRIPITVGIDIRVGASSWLRR